MSEICSLIVHTQPEQGSSVQNALDAISGVEVHGGVEEGKLIVTVEGDQTEQPVSDTIMSLNSIEGVISVTLVYHYGEDDLNEEVIRDIN